MTPNQLRLLIDIFTGNLVDRDYYPNHYPATYNQDLEYLKKENFVYLEPCIETTLKGDYYVQAACDIRLRETYEAYLS
jgi:hypothetical protein